MKNSMVFDIETYYDKQYSLRKLTPPEYILDDRFELHLCAVNLNGKSFDVEGPDFGKFLKSIDPNETTTLSFNSLFDNCVLAYRYGWVPRMMVDVLGMARSLLHHKSKRLGLGEVAKLLGLANKTDLILKVQGMHAADIKAKGLWPAYRRYAMRDMQLCGQAFAKLIPYFPKEELQVMDLVLRCAVQPVFQADVPMLTTYLEDLRKLKESLLKKAGCDKAALMSTAKFKALLDALGVPVQTKISKATGQPIPAFAKTDAFMQELANDDNFEVQALAAARLSQRSTIDETRAQKFLSISTLQWENGQQLLPVPLRYGGAHTHRLSGEWRVNLQNLPRDASKSKLRSALIAPPGYLTVSADLSQIEARLVAWLAGCPSLLRQFRTGQDPYAQLAQRIFGYRVTKDSHPIERFIGKTGILGLGYGCGVDRFFIMVQSQARQAGLELGTMFSYRTADRTVDVYRYTYWEIPALWRKLDHRLRTLNYGPEHAPLGPQSWREDCNEGGWGSLRQFDKYDLITIKKGAIVLPNGMELRYTVPDDKLYGAKLLENVTQALARIVVMQAALRLSQRGLRFALQAHDELVFVVPEENLDTAQETILSEMIRQPVWAPGLPLAAEVGHGRNYGECK
jgi:DNA polymerase bacteriophage-type